MIIQHAPALGYAHNPNPDRYPTRADWPRPGTQGTHKGRPVTLVTVYHAYWALFQSGPYSTLAADLQGFVCE